MSNAQKTSSGTFSLADYRKKAEKEAEKAGPFVLQVSPEQSITIEWPSSAQMFEAENAQRAGDSRGFIAAVCGDHAEDVIELFGDDNYKALGAFGEDLQKHFKIGQ